MGCDDLKCNNDYLENLKADLDGYSISLYALQMKEDLSSLNQPLDYQFKFVKNYDLGKYHSDLLQVDMHHFTSYDGFYGSGVEITQQQNFLNVGQST